MKRKKKVSGPNSDFSLRRRLLLFFFHKINLVAPKLEWSDRVRSRHSVKFQLQDGAQLGAIFWLTIERENRNSVATPMKRTRVKIARKLLDSATQRIVWSGQQISDGAPGSRRVPFNSMWTTRRDARPSLSYCSCISDDIALEPDARPAVAVTRYAATDTH